MEELKVELASLKEAKRDEKKSQVQLEEKLATATEELTKEKVKHFFIMHNIYIYTYIFYIKKIIPESITSVVFLPGTCGFSVCAVGAGARGVRGANEAAEGRDGGGARRACSPGRSGAEEAGGGGEESGGS